MRNPLFVSLSAACAVLAAPCAQAVEIDGRIDPQ